MKFSKKKSIMKDWKCVKLKQKKKNVNWILICKSIEKYLEKKPKLLKFVLKSSINNKLLTVISLKT